MQGILIVLGAVWTKLLFKRRDSIISCTSQYPFRSWCKCGSSRGKSGYSPSRIQRWTYPKILILKSCSCNWVKGANGRKLTGMLNATKSCKIKKMNTNVIVLIFDWIYSPYLLDLHLPSDSFWEQHWRPNFGHTNLYNNNEINNGKIWK
jgi:hypothetical protein